MLARFKNGYFLEVRLAEDENTKEYDFCVYDSDGNELYAGWTEYRDMDLYYPKNEIDYILEFCEPKGVSGEYELLESDSVYDYLKSLNDECTNEMNPREVAEYLSKCTDKEFVEVFALLYHSTLGRCIPTEYDTEWMIKNLDEKHLCNLLERLLTEMKGE